MNSNQKILVSDNLSKEGLEILRDSTTKVDYLPEISREELIKAVKNYNALLIRSRTKVDKEVIEACQSMKVIGRAGVGIDNINLESATKKGIIVLNSPEGNTNSVAELVVGLMINFSRNILVAQESMFSGKWDRKKLIGTELKNKTLGIVGLGKIGSRVAQLAKIFDLKLLAYDPVVSEQVAKQLSVRLVKEISEIWEQSDFISLHVPKIRQTENLVDQDALDQMKKSAVVINCARGGIIDEKALYLALKKNRIKGAALDVYDREPLDPNSFLIEEELKNKKLILLPHLGASTEEAQKNVAIDTAKQIKEVLAGQITNGVVNFTKINTQELKSIEEYLKLARLLGLFLAQFIGSARPNELQVIIQGKISKKETELLTLSALEAFLSYSTDSVNLVNSKAVAQERGLKITESKTEGNLDKESEIILRIKTNLKSFRIAGVIKNNQKVVITKINEFDFYLDLGSFMLLTRHNDQPGVLAEIVKILAEEKINISNLALGRGEKKELSSAIMICSLDSKLNLSTLEKIKKISQVEKVSFVEIFPKN